MLKSVFFYALSCVEFFEFDVSGSRFLPPDMAVAGNRNDAAGMAKKEKREGTIWSEQSLNAEK